MITKIVTGFPPFSFPILQEPMQLLQLFSLIDGELPVLDLVLFQPAQMEIVFPYKISFPVWDVPEVTLGVEGHLEAFTNIAVGFDTYGMSKGLNASVGDFFLDAMDGFYFANSGNTPSRCGFSPIEAGRNCYVDCTTNKDCPKGLSCYHGLPAAICLNPGNASLPPPVTNLGIGLTIDLFAEVHIWAIIEVKIFGGVGFEAEVMFNDPNADGKLRATELYELYQYADDHPKIFPLAPFLNLHLNASFNFGFYFWTCIIDHKFEWRITIFNYEFGLNYKKFQDWKHAGRFKLKDDSLKKKSSLLEAGQKGETPVGEVWVFRPGSNHTVKQQKITKRKPHYPKKKSTQPRFHLNLEPAPGFQASSWITRYSNGPSVDLNQNVIKKTLGPGNDFVRVSDFSVPYYLDGGGGTGHWGDVLVVDASDTPLTSAVELFSEGAWFIVSGLGASVHYKNFKSVEIIVGKGADSIKVGASADHTVLVGNGATSLIVPFDVSNKIKRHRRVPTTRENVPENAIDVYISGVDHIKVEDVKPTDVQHQQNYMGLLSADSYPVVHVSMLSVAATTLNTSTVALNYLATSTIDIEFVLPAGQNAVSIHGTPRGSLLLQNDIGTIPYPNLTYPDLPYPTQPYLA